MAAGRAVPAQSAPSGAPDAQYTPRTWPPTFHLTEVVPGVYAVIQALDSSGIVHGNEVFVVNDSSVFVFDANFTPAAARATIALLKTVTDKPVRDLAYSHWHNDHVWGTQSFLEAYPGPINLIASDSTRDDIIHEDRAKHAEIVKYYVDAYKATDSALTKGVDPGTGKPLTAIERLDLLSQQDALKSYMMPESRTIIYHPPTITYHQRMTLFRGTREIDLFDFGRGNTRGDGVVFLPSERVVFTGHLLVAPIPFSFGSYLSNWITALHAVRALNAKYIIPGHGPVMSDYAYLDLVARFLTAVVAQTRRAAAAGLTLQQTQKRVLLESFRTTFTHGDHLLDGDWDTLVATAVQRAYLEATHKLVSQD
jgi:glyoxylase-like metal-dependent hydrolase (beta-lactamase superfamily II)